MELKSVVRVSRSRNRSVSTSGYYADYVGVSDTIRSRYDRTDTNLSTISDWTGRPVSAGGLNSSQRRGFLYLNGTNMGSHGLMRYFKCPVYPSSGIPTEPMIGPPAGWVLTLVAGTNPSRPVVTPPELLQNIYELPKMLRNLAAFLSNPNTILTPKGAANEYLGIKFGWLPMIKDIQDVLNLQDHIDKRLREINQLHSGRGLRRKRPFGDRSWNYACSLSLGHYGTAGTLVKFSANRKQAAWGTIRWKPTEALPYHPSDLRYRNHVRNVVLGLTPEGLAKGLWNVIPWTWLAGWFTNVGSLILSRSNSIGASWSEACFMSQSTLTVTGSGVTVTGFGGREIDARVTGSYTGTTKTRIIGTAITPGFFMPILDMSRLSVLGALVLQRFR